MNPQLLKDISLAYAGAAIALASNTDSNSTRFDMAGFEGIVFFTTINDSVATGVATLKVEQNTADSDSGMAALAGATASLTCVVNDDINGKVLAVDVYQPKERYVQGVRVSATANIAFGEIYAIRYKAKKLPVAAHSTIGASASVTSPAES